MKSIKALISLIIAITLSSQAYPVGRGFAVIIDDNTYSACKKEIENYAQMLKNEGFNAIIYSKNWNNPMEVRDTLFGMYKSAGGMDGAIFIGQIPVPMIRDAQYMTSAFKMDQTAFSMRESSVPSDRYYDDFDLKFDYLGKDTTEKLFHYFSLRWDSPQRISCDIYTGRVKPTLKDEAGYDQIRRYFRKVVFERTKYNPLNIITTYTGEGSFSNSLTAWKDEGVLLREQFPNSFKKRQEVKLLFYRMYPYMKELVTDELRRDEMDLMIFHEHGMPERQYLSEQPASIGADEYIEAAKRMFREKLRKSKDTTSKQLLKKQFMSYYNIDSTWFKGTDDKNIIAEDSVNEANTGILLKDIPRIKPNARMVIFDACYNGDFREESYIGAEYIFADGKTVVTFGNSANVLQDKSSSDLMGMLGMGFRVGEWAKMTNILESHITGDPTFRFTSDRASNFDLKADNIDYWLNVFNKYDSPDIKGIALWKLFDLKYVKMPELLAKTYENSPYFSLRLQVYHLLQYYNSPFLSEMLKNSVNDSYEFIRRKSLFSIGRIGSEIYLPYIVKSFIYDNLDERVFFNSIMCFDLFNEDLLRKEFYFQLSNYKSETGKKVIEDLFTKTLASRKSIAKMANDVTDKNRSLKSRLMAVSMLRNNPYHNMVEDYLQVLSDNSEDIQLKIKLAEALGWFTLSEKRNLIVSKCEQIALSENIDETFKRELLKTAARIKVFMR